jgi:hypothetical protein
MTLKIPNSLPPKKETSRQKINEDEFEAIFSILNDPDIGTEGGEIDETKELDACKEKSIHNDQVKGDEQDSLFDKSRNRVLDGNEQFNYSIYTVKKGENLRDIAINVYGDANAWVILAAINDIVNPSSESQIYPGRKLYII